MIVICGSYLGNKSAMMQSKEIERVLSDLSQMTLEQLQQRRRELAQYKNNFNPSVSHLRDELILVEQEIDKRNALLKEGKTYVPPSPRLNQLKQEWRDFNLLYGVLNEYFFNKNALPSKQWLQANGLDALGLKSNESMKSIDECIDLILLNREILEQERKRRILELNEVSNSKDANYIGALSQHSTENSQEKIIDQDSDILKFKKECELL